MVNLAQSVKIIRVMNAQAAGSTPVNSSVVDMEGYEGIYFVASFGALVATQVTSLKAQQDTVLAFTDDPQDLLGTLVGPLADGDGNKQLGLDIHRPRERFVRVVVNRATANATIDGVVAILYGPRKAPPAKDATMAFLENHQSPAEGAA